MSTLRLFRPTIMLHSQLWLRTSVTINQRCWISISKQCLKKHKQQKKTPPSVAHLKREAPFVFSVVKKFQGKNIMQIDEEPMLFQPLSRDINQDDLIDDRSQLLNDLKIKPTHKKETAFIIQPNFKWGKGRFITKLSDSRLSEAKALVESIQSWGVHDSCIESVHENNPKLFFGSGKIIELSKRIRTMINENNVTMVFLNTGKLSQRQIKELEAAWGCKVFDRYRVVLELFKERASTREAKLQVQLAEVQYLRTHLSSSDFDYDQQRGGGKGMMGSGQTYMEKARRQLTEAETKIKKALGHIKQQRNQTKTERARKSIPQIALVGYTNAGKTTLAKLLSKDAKMQPEDRLFATLDTTAHQGKLPSGMNALFIDTVGFISDLPHELVESFATTLEDVKTSDLIIHVSDCSHPEFELQKNTVEDVLKKLKLSEHLQDNMIHVLNKADLRTAEQESSTLETDDHHLLLSATSGEGAPQLLDAIQHGLLKSTGRGQYQINIDQSGEELSFLYRHGTVVSATGLDDGTLDVVTILDQPNRGRFEKHFHVKLKNAN
eukprot:TCONS_00022417-protein